MDANRNYLMQNAFDAIQTQNELHDELNMMDSLVNEAYSIGETNNTPDLGKHQILFHVFLIFGLHFLLAIYCCSNTVVII